MFNKIKTFLFKNIKWIILFYCVIAFIFIMRDVLSNEVIEYDKNIYNFISKFIHDDNTKVIKIITNLGHGIPLVLITLLIMFLVKNKRFGILVGTNLVTVVIINNILKLIVRRDRPTIFPIIDEIGYSFPSGHSMVSMAFYGFIIYLIYKNVKNRKIKWLLIPLISFLIIIIGISRIYLGVHYVSDVLAGFLIAIAYLILFIKVTKGYLLNKG